MLSKTTNNNTPTNTIRYVKYINDKKTKLQGSNKMILIIITY